MEVIESIYQRGLRRYWFNFERGVVSPYQLYKYYIGEVQAVIPMKDWARFRQVFTYAYFREAFGNVFVPKPKAIDFVAGLRSWGCKVVLVSNNNPIHYEYCVRVSGQIFSKVDDCVLSHEVGYRKPDPEIWRVALEIAGSHLGRTIFPERVFCVDDKPENVDSFKALGGNGAVFKSVEDLKEDLGCFGFEFNRLRIPA